MTCLDAPLASPSVDGRKGRLAAVGGPPFRNAARDYNRCPGKCKGSRAPGGRRGNSAAVPPARAPPGPRLAPFPGNRRAGRTARPHRHGRPVKKPLGLSDVLASHVVVLVVVLIL